MRSETAKNVPIHRGVTFGFYARNGYYGSAEARQQVDRMKELNYESRWFESMPYRTLHYARLATRAACEAYGLDSEIDHIVHLVEGSD
jgi:hypothetical protein